MRICLLQSSYDDVDNVFKTLDHSSDPGQFTDQHTFEHRFIRKESAKDDLISAAAESFDLYFNFMWGQHEDAVAGIDAVKYLESLGIPFIGMPSRILERSKEDFYESARRLGKPEVPGSTKFPKFVKPNKACGSLGINDLSFCRNQEEVDAAVLRLEHELASHSVYDRENAKGHITSGLGSDHRASEIIVQEFVPGKDYSCVVIEMGNRPVSLSPTIYRYPGKTRSPFLTFETKWHPDLYEEVFRRQWNPKLYDNIRHAAETAYHSGEMQGCSWCNVDIRATDDGEVTVIEVNPMPALFLSEGHQWEDVVIEESFPGGHRALIISVIASYFLQAGRPQETFKRVGGKYDEIAVEYNSKYCQAVWRASIRDIASTYDFEGIVLDLACGTRLFGRLYAEVKGEKKSSTLIGIELSPGMRAECLKHGQYDQVHVGPMQRMLPAYNKPVDHILCLGALHFLSVAELSLVLSRCFQLAQRSVTLTIDEIPSIYNEKLRTQGYAYMHSLNHLAEVKAYGTPRGWKLADNWRRPGWNSPTTGDDIYTRLFRFEKLVQEP